MRGEVVYLYAFDVATEIVTAKVQEILTNKPFPFEIRVDHTLPKDVPLYKPLAIEAAPLTATLAGRPVRPLIRVYEVGVVSIALRVPFEVEGLADLLPFHECTLENGQTLDQVACELCAAACKSLQDVMIQPSAAKEPEAYTVFCLTDIGAAGNVNAGNVNAGNVNAGSVNANNVNQWLAGERRAVAELLSESRPGVLSDGQVDEVLRIQFSYANTDVTVIDWDAALVVDLTGYVEDVLYVLEMANLQLEEYRVMDQRLDNHLNRAYEDVRRPRFVLFGAYSAVLSTLRIFRVDATKLNDEVTHITKFVGDWYLARVYMGARERFHLNQWRNSVADRLSQLDKLYTVVHTEVTNKRMVWLEILIAVFFAIDLLEIFLLTK